MGTRFSGLTTSGGVGDRSEVLFGDVLVLLGLLVTVFLRGGAGGGGGGSDGPSSRARGSRSSAVSGNSGNGNGLRSSTATGGAQAVRVVELVGVRRYSMYKRSLDGATYSRAREQAGVSVIFRGIIRRMSIRIGVYSAYSTAMGNEFPASVRNSLGCKGNLGTCVIGLLIYRVVSLGHIRGLVGSVVNRIVTRTALLGFIFQLCRTLRR